MEFPKFVAFDTYTKYLVSLTIWKYAILQHFSIDVNFFYQVKTLMFHNVQTTDFTLLEIIKLN